MARHLEERLERLVDGISAVIFRGRMHPVDLGNRLVRHIDMATAIGPAGPEISNTWTVRVNPSDVWDQADLGELATELAHTVRATAEQRGWRTSGPVSVHVRTDERVPVGSIKTEHESRPGALRPWGQLLPVNGSQVHALSDNRVLVGRADDVAVQLSEPTVSRHHGVIYRLDGRHRIADLRSANGTFVNERHVGASATIAPGDTVRFGPASFTFRLL